MTTTPLRVGDRVRATVAAYGDNTPVGALGTVVSLYGTYDDPYVQFDCDPEGDTGGGWSMFHSQVERVTRGWRDRVWFYKPQLHWHGWRTLLPLNARGGDEWDWHTLTLGWTVTGRVVVALRRCPQTGRCADEEPLSPDWPADPYPDLPDQTDSTVDA